MRRCRCKDRQKQCNRNYMVMDDIYVTTETMWQLRKPKQQNGCDTSTELILSHMQNISGLVDYIVMV